MGGSIEQYEELTSIGTRSPVRHADQTAPGMAYRVPELARVRVTRVAGPIPLRIAALRHESGDDSVEGKRVVEAEPGQVDRAGDVHGCHIREQADHQRPSVGFKLPEVPALGVEGEHGRRRNSLVPAALRAIDRPAGDEAVDLLQQFVDGGDGLFCIRISGGLVGLAEYRNGHPPQAERERHCQCSGHGRPAARRLALRRRTGLS